LAHHQFIWNIGHSPIEAPLLGWGGEAQGGSIGETLSTPPPPLSPQRKKANPSSVHAELSHWLHETFLFKKVCHHFWPGLMAGPQTVRLW
jgi:hypothetical protein